MASVVNGGHLQPTPAHAEKDNGGLTQRVTRFFDCRPIRSYLWFRQLKVVTVEPVLFLYMFGIFMALSTSQEYIFNWYGREMLAEHSPNHSFPYPFNFCISTERLNEIPMNVTGGKKAADIVQTQASALSLATTLLGQLPSIFAALIYGPLTDRIGRKPIMLLMGSAGALSGLLFSLAVHFSWPIYWFIPLTLITSLAGGIPGILTVVYSYIADVSSTKWLTLRLAIVESMVFFGTMASLAIGGVWLDYSGCKFGLPFILYFMANVLLLVYVIFLLPESLTKSQRRAKVTMSGCRHVLRGLQIFFTRNEYSRWRLWCAVGCMFMIYMVITGAAEISTLFLLHAPLRWTPGAIGIFQSLTQFSFAISIFLFIPILVFLHISDPVILIVGVVWGTVCYFLTGFVRTGWEMYAVGVIQGVESISGPPIRSTISKAVALQDQGAAFSILASFQVLAASLAAIVFYFFYPLTLSLGLPAGTSYFLMAGLNLLQMPLAIMLLVYYKKPGAVYQEQKSISERVEEKGEDLTVSVDGEGGGEGEESSLLPHGRGHGEYGSAEIQ